MLSSDELSRLTTTLFSASMGKVDWEYFLAELSSQTGDICTHMFGYDLEANINIDLAAYGYAPEHIETYNQYYAELNAWAPGFVAHQAGVVVDCENMCRSEELVRTEFYNDWLRPQEDIVQGGGALLFKNDTRVFALGGNIRLKDSDRLKQRWLQTVHQLIPHMQQALEISRMLAGQKLETAIVAKEGLRRTPGLLVLSDRGRIIFANEIAQTMVSQGYPVSCDIQGNLTYGHDSEARRINANHFRHQLSSASPSFSVILPKVKRHRGYKLRFIKIDRDTQVLLPFDNMFGFSSACAMLLIEEVSSHIGVEDQLIGRFGFTQAEAEVALFLGEGVSTREIAEHRGVSIHTVRSQVKAAMAKLHTRRQTELVLEIHKLASS